MHARDKTQCPLVGGAYSAGLSAFCHRSIHLRTGVFPCSLRTRHPSAGGYVPCATEKISGTAYGRLCLGDENHTLTVGDCSHPPNCFLLGRVCGSTNAPRKVVSFDSDSSCQFRDGAHHRRTHRTSIQPLTNQARATNRQMGSSLTRMAAFQWPHRRRLRWCGGLSAAVAAHQSAGRVHSHIAHVALVQHACAATPACTQQSRCEIKAWGGHVRWHGQSLIETRRCEAVLAI